MELHKISDGKNGSYTIFKGSDIEFSDPVKYFSACFIEPRVSIETDFLLMEKLPIPIQEISEFVRKRAIVEWEKKFKELNETKIPENFISLLKSESKKEQVQLLKEQSLTPNQLIAFIFKAFSDYKFTFSQYSAEHHHGGLGKDDYLPRVAEIKGDRVEKVGRTSLSDGQLKHLIRHRKIIVSKFLDNGKNWHCFFVTFKSLRGEETWKDGQPHFHYISDKFGIGRDKVVSDLKSKYYNLGSLPHIDLVGYRDKK